jgi:hypothetical protein
LWGANEPPAKSARHLDAQEKAAAGRAAFGRWRKTLCPHLTINDQAGQLDAVLTDKVDVALTGTTSPLVLTDAQALRCMVLKLTGNASRRGLACAVPAA